VLRDLEKPYAELREAAGRSTSPEAGVVAARPPPAASVTPVTPVTPVSMEAFTSLQNTIIREDARKLDEVDKQRLMRHLEKIAKAGKALLAKSALQEGHIRFLHKINDEGKARRSTRAIVLGTAKVMSYEDLEEAKAKRAKQGEKKVKRGKQGGGKKQNAGASKARKSRTDPGAELTSDRSFANNDANQVAEPNCAVEGLVAPCPGRAPIARMW
jgi:hypothetical protein